MTLDEFERILIAASNMHSYNFGNGQIYVPLKAVIDVVQSQLHSEDRGKWTFYNDNGKIGWRKNSE